MDAYKIGQFIKQLRTEKNLSQYQLADMIPITRQAVSKWERGVSVADSLTLIKLSEIFGVTVDELLTGERKNKDTSDKMKEVTLSMVDENISKGKKIKKIVIIDIIILVLLALLFLTYYFVNSYNSMKFYSVSGESKNFKQSNGVIIISKKKIYFQSGEINCNDDIKIKEIKLFYTLKDKDYLVYSTKDSNFLIVDYYGYDSYFSYKDADKIIKSLYLEITYNESDTEKIKLNVTNNFSNSNLLFSDFSTLLNNISIKNDTAKLITSNIIDNDNSDDKLESKNKDNEKIENSDKKKITNSELAFKIDDDENKTEEKTISSDKNKEYEKILYYLDHKDLMIEMIKKTFKLDTSQEGKFYVYKNRKGNEEINLNYTEQDNVLNIYAKSNNIKYDCYWMLDFDIIKLSFYEDNILINETNIMKNDITLKNEKYQILANIIFKYFDLFLN